MISLMEEMYFNVIIINDPSQYIRVVFVLYFFKISMVVISVTMAYRSFLIQGNIQHMYRIGNPASRSTQLVVL